MRLNTSPMIAALLTAGLLSACGANDDTAAAKTAPAEQNSDTSAPIADAKTEAAPKTAPPAFNHAGMWVEDRAQCSGSDQYIAINADGTIHGWGQDGRWTAEGEDTLVVRMRSSPGTEMSDAMPAWTDRFSVEVHGPNSMTMLNSRGLGATLHRCP